MTKPAIKPIFLTILWAVMLSTCPPGRLAAQALLTWQQAVITGLENNYSVRLQQDQARIAAGNNTIGNAGFLPALTLSSGQNNTFNTTHQEQFSGTVRDVKNAKSSTFNAGVTLNWTLFDGFGMFAGKRMLDILDQLGENGSRIILEGAVSDITITYYSIVQMKKLAAVAREAALLSAERRKIAEARITIGSGSELMLLQSTVDLNADSTRLVRQLTLLSQACADLNLLLGRDPSILFETEDTIPMDPPLPFDTLLARSEKQNSALETARLKQLYARQGVSLARSDRYPTLGLQAGYGYNTLNAQTGFLKSNESYGPSFGLSLTYPLFNGFNVDRAVRNARILMHSGDLALEQAGLELKGNLYATYQSYAGNLEILRMQTANIAVARENVAVALEQYRLGILDDLAFREIQLKLLEAESQRIVARFEAKKAETELKRLSGTLGLPRR